MVVYYHKAVYHEKKLVHYLQCQGHSEGLYNQNMTMSTLFSKILVRLQPNLVLLYDIVSWIIQYKNWVTVFKVKVTARVQNVSDCLSG